MAKRLSYYWPAFSFARKYVYAGCMWAKVVQVLLSKWRNVPSSQLLLLLLLSYLKLSLRKLHLNMSLGKGQNVVESFNCEKLLENAT